MIGQVIARYRILQKLGAGGMGEVYLAVDSTLHRQVALKFLPPEYTQDPERLRRFKQEARAASALNHPNILTIYDIGEEGAHHFIATEFVDGESLRALLERDGAMAVDAALRVAKQVASALAAAHAEGIIHRDIKPENVMLRHDGYAKVLDFGLAKLLETRADRTSDRLTSSHTSVVHTESGIVLGTTSYMSPEHATGGDVDGRSDIFAFGALLYEMLAGRRAFSGNSAAETIAAILTKEPAPLPSHVPADVAKVVARSLRKDPARRFQTMTDLNVALDDAVEEASAGASLRSWARPWTWGVLLMVLLAGGIIVSRPWARGSTTDPMAAVPLTTLPGVARYPSFSPGGDRVAFTWTGESGDNPDVYVQQIGAGLPLRLTSDSANDFSPVWSPDGRWIAFLRSHAEAGRSELRLIPPLGGAERKLTDIVVRGGTAVTPPYLAWCPRSDCLIVTHSPGPEKSDALFVVSLESGEQWQLTTPEPPAGGDTNPAVSPDGTRLLFRRMASLYSGELYELSFSKDMRAAAPPRRLTDATVDAEHPTWLPNGDEIVFAARGALWRMSVSGDMVPRRLPYVGEYGIMPVVWGSPARGDSRLVYVRSFDDVNIWRVRTAAPGERATAAPEIAISSTRADDMPQFSPDGQRVAFTSDRSGGWEIYVSDPNGANAIQLTSMGARASGYPHWSPDAQQIAFHSNGDGQWEVYTVPAGGGKPRNLTMNPAADAFPSFSHDGKWIYFSSNRGGTPYQSVWRIPASGGAAEQVTAHAGVAPRESPDGAFVYYIESLDPPGTLWRMPTSGGAAEKVLDGVYLANYAVLDGGIYYAERSAGARGVHYMDQPSGETTLLYYHFATRKTTAVATNLGRIDIPIAVAPDGRTVLFGRIDTSVNDLMLVNNFR